MPEADCDIEPPRLRFLLRRAHTTSRYRTGSLPGVPHADHPAGGDTNTNRVATSANRSRRPRPVMMTAPPGVSTISVMSEHSAGLPRAKGGRVRRRYLGPLQLPGYDQRPHHVGQRSHRRAGLVLALVSAGDTDPGAGTRVDAEWPRGRRRHRERRPRIMSPSVRVTPRPGPRRRRRGFARTHGRPRFGRSGRGPVRHRRCWSRPPVYRPAPS